MIKGISGAAALEVTYEGVTVSKVSRVDRAEPEPLIL
jgi:hypothetical protein